MTVLYLTENNWAHRPRKVGTWPTIRHENGGVKIYEIRITAPWVARWPGGKYEQEVVGQNQHCPSSATEQGNAEPEQCHNL